MNIWDTAKEGSMSVGNHENFLNHRLILEYCLA
jgi:hypothetical protein